MKMFKKRLVELRKAKNLTQKAVSEKLSVDVSTVRKWELGYRKPDINYLCKLADFFDVSTDYLLGRNTK